MTNLGKRYQNIKKQIPEERQDISEGLRICKETASAKFDESIDVVFSLNIDTKDPEQNIRTTVSLPNGSGKTVRIAVFAGGEELTEAEKAGADIVGGKDLATKVSSEEKLDVDIVISTPEMMAEVGQLGKILGPQGLMPNPKTGTVTNDIKGTIENINKGLVAYKNDKAGTIHAALGKVSFDEKKLSENISSFIEEIKKIKPSGIKGNFIHTVFISSTMGLA